MGLLAGPASKCMLGRGRVAWRGPRGVSGRRSGARGLRALVRSRGREQRWRGNRGASGPALAGAVAGNGGCTELGRCRPAVGAGNRGWSVRCAFSGDALPMSAGCWRVARPGKPLGQRARAAQAHARPRAAYEARRRAGAAAGGRGVVGSRGVGRLAAGLRERKALARAPRRAHPPPPPLPALKAPAGWLARRRARARPVPANGFPARRAGGPASPGFRWAGRRPRHVRVATAVD